VRFQFSDGTMVAQSVLQRQLFEIARPMLEQERMNHIMLMTRGTVGVRRRMKVL
jgi:hypothetical protein